MICIPDIKLYAIEQSAPRAVSEKSNIIMKNIWNTALSVVAAVMGAAALVISWHCRKNLLPEQDLQFSGVYQMGCRFKIMLPLSCHLKTAVQGSACRGASERGVVRHP